MSRLAATPVMQALRDRKPAAVAGAIVLVVALVGGGTALAVTMAGGQGKPGVGPTAVALQSATPTPTPMQPFTLPPTTPSATPAEGDLVAATTNGVLLPADQASLATRHPIAVMIDDHWAARPQTGLSQADIVYQAPAESGIPRYMAIFQTQDPPLIGPVRSSRQYFVPWAEEWRAMYVHCGGASNALEYLTTVNKTYIWNADEFRWGGVAGYFWRDSARSAPHNVYTSSEKLHSLAKHLGATEPFTETPWAFGPEVEVGLRPTTGTISVPYRENLIGYQYDRASNKYFRSVTGERIQTDAGNGQLIAPSNVVVMYQKVYALAGAQAEAEHRLDIKYLGSGPAVVFNNGQVIEAQWSKKTDSSPTLVKYASGPLKGQPVPLVRGQIFVQVVPPDMEVTWEMGLSQAPENP
jgi:hypothetical protein